MSALSGAPPAGKANTLLLNGSTQYLNCGRVDKVDNISVSMWIRTNAIGSDQIIANRWLEGTNNISWVFYINTSGFLTVAYSTNGQVSGIGSLNTTHSVSVDTWYFVTMRIASGVISVSKDNGVEQSSGAVSIFVGTALLEIAGRTDLSASFDGAISGFVLLDSGSDQRTELYNAGLSKQPWMYSQPLRDSMLLALPLNGSLATGREFEDYSGNENNPTPVGSPTITGTLIDIDPGLVYNSFDYTGARYVDGTNGPSIQALPNISISLWVYPTANGTVIAKNGPILADGGWLVTWGGFVSNQFTFGPRIGGSQSVVHSGTLNTNEWFHVCVTYDGTNLKMYTNGVLDNTTNSVGTIDTNNTQNMNIGRDTGGGSTSFEGSITQPMIFNRALTSTEVTTVYNQNLPKDYAQLPTSITNDCVLAYEMTSNDNSLTDLSVNTNNGTANGGVTSNGSEIDWDNT